MGIPQFFGKFLKNKDGKWKGLLTKRVYTKIKSLCIDLNGIIHETAGEIYHYNFGSKDRNEAKRQELLKEFPSADPSTALPDLFAMRKINSTILMREHFALIDKKVKDLVWALKPEMLILAVDGLAPMAKIVQQRQRRYKAVGNNAFDSNCITPGTVYMKYLDDFLISRKYNVDKLYYTGPYTPGEGEHKIMDYFRKNPDDSKGTHIIYGLDADLIILCMLSGLEKSYVMRNPAELVSINVIKTGLMNDYKITPVDFALLTCFIGNDFIPRNPYFNNVEDSLNVVLKYYTKSLVHNGKIDFVELQKLLQSALPDLKVLFDTAPEYDYPDPLYKNKNFEKEWYYRATFPNIKDTRVISTLNLPRYSLSTESAKMIVWYFNMFDWVIKYYTGQVYSTNKFYPYFYTPLLSSIVKKDFTHNFIYDLDDTKFNIIDQLICVLPPRSKNLIPISVPKELNFCFPSKFDTLLLAKMKDQEHESIAILPFPRIDLIKAVTANAKSESKEPIIKTFNYFNAKKLATTVRFENIVNYQRKYIDIQSIKAVDIAFEPESEIKPFVPVNTPLTDEVFKLIKFSFVNV